MPLTPGQVLQNRYRIESLLGQGGMGAVYRAVDLTFQAAVAIKENLDPSTQAQRQFEREARILYGLRHPNLPRVVDYFAIEGRGQYLVMDFVDGIDLGHIMAHGPVPEAQALLWIDQVLDALCYLHNQNPPIIHRDIKPANVKITSRGQAMLVDFGLAKTHNPVLITSSGAQGVTPGYAPPEQYSQQGRTDARSDLYAVGATLYALLVGKAPPESIDRVMETAVLTSPRTLNPSISSRTEKAILKAMDTRPTNRPQTAAELRLVLAGRAAASGGQPAPGPQTAQAQAERVRSKIKPAAGSRIRPPSRATPPSSPGAVQSAGARSKPGLDKGILVGIVVLALIGVFFLAMFFFARPLPEAPLPLVVPLRYVAQQGDTPAAIAAYFRVPAADVPADVNTGRTIELTPGDHAVHFSGRVHRMEEIPGGLALEVGSHSERYRVRIDTGAAGMLIQEAYAPEDGNTVAVVGYPAGDGTVMGLGIDVAAGQGWRTWYRRPPGGDLWIYSVVHENLIPAVGDLAGFEDRRVLFLGHWSPSGSALQFDWDPADLYVLDGSQGIYVYVRAVPYAASRPLSTRFPSDSTPAPAITGEPGEADTEAPPASSAPEGTVTGTIREAVGGIFVRAMPSPESEALAARFNGDRMSIQCRAVGSDVNGNTTWYGIAGLDFEIAYVPAFFVALDAGYLAETIDMCR